MHISLTELRSNIFKYFDQIKETNTLLEVSDKRGHFIITYVKPINRIKTLEENGLDLFNGDADDIINVKWPMSTREEENLK